jgi:hypothetical protein
VHVLKQPLVDARQELAATLHAWNPDHGESSTAINSTNVFEAQKLERLRLLTVTNTSLGCETAKE